jgi:hypothetical protein
MIYIKEVYGRAKLPRCTKSDPFVRIQTEVGTVILKVRTPSEVEVMI